MVFLDVFLKILLHLEELVAGGALEGDVLKQLLIRVHPLEVPTKGGLEKIHEITRFTFHIYQNTFHYCLTYCIFSITP